MKDEFVVILLNSKFQP